MEIMIHDIHNWDVERDIIFQNVKEANKKGHDSLIVYNAQADNRTIKDLQESGLQVEINIETGAGLYLEVMWN